MKNDKVKVKRRARNSPLYLGKKLRHKRTKLKKAKYASSKSNKSIFVASLAVFIVIFALFAAKAFNLFDVTLGGEISSSPKPSPISSALPSSTPSPTPLTTTSSGTDVTSTEPESTPTVNSGLESEKPLPTESENGKESSKLPAPEEGSPSYMSLYPELNVPKSEFSEIDPDDKVVYITFDDGPCKSTERLLDVLDDLGIKATFFVSAQYAEREELIRLMKETADRGHEVAVHGYSHKYKEIYSSVDAFIEDYKKIDDLIVEATGKRNSIYRFPGGSNTGYNSAIRKELIAEMDRRGFIYHDWNAHNGDSEGYGPEEQVERAVREVLYGNRKIVLMHNTPDKDSVIDVLPRIVNQLKDRGYRFDVIDETVKPIHFELPN